MEEIHDLEAERAFLGCAFEDPAQIRGFVAAVEPDDFAKPANGKIWAAIRSLIVAGGAIDHLTVAEALKARGDLGAAGGATYLMELDGAVPFAANVGSYVEIIRDRAIRRRAVEVFRKFARRAATLTEPTELMISEAASALIQSGTTLRATRTLEDVNREVFERLNKIQDGEDTAVIATGLRDWDLAIGGVQPTLTVIAGKTGGGKSALAAGLVQSFARGGNVVGVFSLEDPADWLTYRYIAGASGVPNFVVRYRKKREDEWNQIGQNVDRLAGWDRNVLIDDTPNLTAAQIVARATDWVVNRGAKVIVVDHLQEIEGRSRGGKGAERHELEKRQDLQELRSFANRFGVAVILLVQEKEETPENQPPTRYCAADAPNAVAKISRVMLVVRADPEKGTMDVYVVKHTNGNNRLVIPLRFITHAGLVGSLPEKPAPVADLFDNVDRSLAPVDDEEELPE